jgi:hypothetical protein
MYQYNINNKKEISERKKEACEDWLLERLMYSENWAEWMDGKQ